eukprot:CAMPEP_0115097306 /NCGR_PEP_ID=MMETSP0227-20121206/30361_1 /TAXON_ID=89957 /ORGANISM="Polarella glacialis, Strain CCMP 1383" /LENGTH=299 /DNA_ID=CAMNT_0002491447 /DNA_START=104 /DNA_END=1003 /DNA_ORIENTATION=+
MRRQRPKVAAQLLIAQVLFLRCLVVEGQTEFRQQEHQVETPGTLHWVLAVLLILVLVVGLMRVCRVLRMSENITIARSAPEGMRTVECGSCRIAQYVSAQGRIFICFSCHCANRIPIEIPRMAEQELVIPVGPLKKFEFKKGGENYWQELGHTDLEEGEVGPEPQSAEKVEKESNPQTGDEVISCAASPVETSCSPAPVLVGRKIDEMENESNYVDENGIPQCVVCLDNPGCMVLLPCAHGSVCEVCVTRIAQNRAFGGAHCPHCRSDIETIVKIHEIDGELATGIEFRIPMARPIPSS